MAKLLTHINGRIADAREAISRFQQEVAENPMAIRYGAEDALGHAARLDAFTSVLKVMESAAHLAADSKKTVEVALEYVLDRLTSDAGSLTSQSTSHVTNAFNRAQIAAWADLVRRFS